jgi:hypothetical protein
MGFEALELGFEAGHNGFKRVKIVSGDLWLFTARPTTSWVSPDPWLWQFGDPVTSRALSFLQHRVSGSLGRTLAVWFGGAGLALDDLRLQRFGSMAIGAG